MPDPADRVLKDFLADVRSRALARVRWQLFGSFGAATGLAFLLLVVGAPWMSFFWRHMVVRCLLLVVVAVLYARGRARRLVATEALVARLVRERLPSLGDDLWSAVELGRELPKLDAQPVLSGELVRALRANVATRLPGVKLARIVDLTLPRRRALTRWAALAAAGLALALLRPSLLSHGWHELASDPGDRLTTSADPIVGDLRVELEYPAYTGLPPRAIAGLSGQLLALPGTVIRVEARALVPSHGAAELVVTEDGGTELAHPAEVNGSSLKAHFTVKRAGSFRFVLGGGLRRLREPDGHRVELDPDRPPRVDLYTPADPLEVAGPRRVELAYSVDDDYGLGDIELVWRVGENPEARKVVVPKPSTRSDSGKFEWDLGELDLPAGARVAYHLAVKDNDTISGPNEGRSRTFYLIVSSPREKHEKSVASEEQLLEAAIAQLADRLELRGDQIDDFLPIHSRAETLLVLLAQAAQAAETDKAGGDVGKQLDEMHARLTKLIRDEEALIAPVAHRHAPKPRALDGGNAKLVAELERDVILLDDLLGKQRLEELLRVGDEMAQARDRMKQLLQQYKKTRSEAVKKEIERELRELGRKLAELREKASKMASEMPDQYLNRDAMGKNDIGSDLDKLREKLESGDIDGAMAELDKMSSSLDKMMTSMEGDLREFRGERFSEEDKKLAELEDKVSDLEHDEKQLKNETEAIRQRTRAEAQRQMRDKVEPFVKKAREKVAQLEKHLNDVDRPTLSVWEQEELQRTRERARDLDKLLQEGDLDEARNAARMTERSLKSMGNDLKDDEDRSWRGARPALKKSREHMEEGEKLARQLADDMDQLMPRPDQLMSPEDQARMPLLGEQQKATRRRAGELSRELGQMGKGRERMAEGMKDAGQHMERAEGKLRTHDPRDAEGEEQQALDQLGQMKQQLQNQRRPREQQAGNRLDKEPVRIPGAEEYRAPREFRQDLLEAMKRGAPPEYKDQVKRYYEELVK